MKKNKLKNWLLTLLFLGILIIPQSIAFASALQTEDLMTRVILDPALKPDNSPGVVIGNDTLGNAGAEAAFGNYVLQVVAGGLITVAAPVAIIIIAIAGLIATVSHGDQGLIDKAKKTLTWAVIGLVIIIFSWVIVKAVISVVLMSNQTAPASTTNGAPASPAPAATPPVPGDTGAPQTGG